MLIDKDTIWSAGSVHDLAGQTVQIAAGAKLTVAAGAVVKGGSIEAYGQFVVTGAAGSLVSLQNVSLGTKGSSGRIALDRAHMVGGALQNPTGDAGAANLTLTNSIFENLSGYTYVWYPTSAVLVQGNLFVRSGGFSVGFSGGVGATFSNNTFAEQTTDYAIKSWNGTPLVQGNNFLSTDRIALAIEAGGYTGAYMSAAGNYFGTTNATTIDAMVRDRSDSLTYNSVIPIAPVLTAPNSSAPSYGAVITFGSPPVSSAEGNGGATPFVVTVQRSGKINASATAQWAVAGSDSAAATADDFMGGTLPSGTVNFAAGETSKAITINIAGDRAFEADENFIISLSSPSSGVVIAAASAAGRIANDDSPTGTLSISRLSATQPEGQTGATPFRFLVLRSGDSSGSAWADWSVAGGGVSGTIAAAPSDYFGGGSPSGKVEFMPGDLQKEITVNIAGELTVELNESFTITLSGTPPGISLGNISATGVVFNDDVISTSFSIAGPASAVEGQSGATSVVFTVTRSGSTTGTNAVNFATAGNGAAPADAIDFIGNVLPAGTLTFLAGETSKTITVAIAGDTTAEPDEAFTVTLSAPTNGATITTATASRTILSDDATISIAATSASKPEGSTGGSTPFTFTVTRTGGLAGASSATWTVAGAAVPGTVQASATDFTGGAFPTGTVSFAAGETSKVVTVNVAADLGGELNEGFSVTLSAPSAGTAIGTASATGAILNDDTSFAIATAGATVLEGNAGSTAVVFTVSRAGTTSGTNAVTFAVTGSGGAPADATDFAGAILPTGTLTFLAGETSKTITVNVAGDTTAEADEAFTVTLSNPTNGAAITTAAAGRTILSDDASLSIARTTGNKAEGTGAATAHTFTVTRTGGLSVAHSATWTVAGAAVAGTVQANAADFTGGVFPTGTVSFAAGETSKVITVSISADAAGELNEAFGVTLSAPSAGAVIATPTATSIILNDDTSFAVTTAAATVVEGQAGTTPVVFTVSRAGSTTGTNAVNFAVTGSGANPADAGDFAGGLLANGTLTFLASETSKTITVNVAGDTAAELDEGFTLTLANPTNGAAITTAAASRTILSDDATLSIAATSASKAEGNSGSTPFTFTVTRSGGLAGASSATWTVAGLAGAGTVPAAANDFTGGVFPTGTVSFAAGETSKVITVNVAGDGGPELNERFSVTLSSPSAGTTLGTASAGGLVLNDDFASSAANQTLTGTAGPDTFLLGGGIDSVFALGGTDLFRFQPSAIGPSASNATTLEDFSRALGEVIDLSAIDANTLAGGNDAFIFNPVQGAGFSGAGSLVWQTDGTRVAILGDTNGDFAADVTVFVRPLGTPDANWFIL